jgi:pentatricopeptide repeat protein
LADEYFKLGEFEKAKAIYQKLIKEKINPNEIHDKYLGVLIKLKDFETAEKFLKKQIKANETNVLYRAQNVDLLKSLGKPEEAEKKFADIVSEVKESEQKVDILVNYLMKGQDYEQISTLLTESRKALKSDTKYAIQLARVYLAQGQKDKMIEEVLNYGLYEGGMDVVKATVQDNLKDEKENQIFEKLLYKKVQQFPDEVYYVDLLIWNLLQKKEYTKAFIQARAIDRRQRAGGGKVFELAGTTFTAKEYADAAPMYEYITKEYPRGELYPYSRRLLINCREEIIKTTYPVKEQDIRNLIGDYDKMFKELGITQQTSEALRNQAKLFAFYLDRKDTAKVILEKGIQIAGNNQDFRDKCKLDLGDNYLLQNEQWEATLIYSQVEKTQKENQLGHEAKLSNARLHYYFGDFLAAKDILDVLKQATTREISNDALALSLLIQDNTGLDTVTTAMEKYAAIDLLIFQNKNKEALDSLEVLQKQFASHSLADDIILQKAKIHMRTNQIDLAIEDYKLLLENYKYEVTADDAVYELARIYQYQKNEPTKAMELYQKILVEFPGSIYGADSRKNYRKLRGDIIN